MLDVGGQDATEAFEDVGHSDEAREILEGLLVGTLKRQVFCPPSFHNSPTPPGPAVPATSAEGSVTNTSYCIYQPAVRHSL
jgi:cytochrome b involved in lipid metabolism